MTKAMGKSIGDGTLTDRQQTLNLNNLISAQALPVIQATTGQFCNAQKRIFNKILYLVQSLKLLWLMQDAICARIMWFVLCLECHKSILIEESHVILINFLLLVYSRE